MYKILISAIILSDAKTGYYRVLRNLLISFPSSNYSTKFILYFCVQQVAFKNLDLPDEVIKCPSIKFIITPNFKSKWLRGFYEQLIIPFLSLFHKVHKIFMPATFGLFFPFKPVITFVHTNTSFSLNQKLIGRSNLQKYVHFLLIYVTSLTSSILIFTTKQTYSEYCSFLKKSFPQNIVGNGFIPSTNFINYSQLNDTYIFKTLPQNYILSISQIYRLKNFDSLIYALKLYNKTSENPLHLIIVGSIQEFDYYQEINSIYPKFVHFYHNVSDKDLLYLTNNCIFYSNLSLFEGFSLTPGEAILCNKPLLLSNIPVHREIYSNYAVFTDPLNIPEIVNSMNTVLIKPKIFSKTSFLKHFSQKSFNKRLFSYFV